ncbi:MAG: SpoIIE family protein phosphatase [Oligoflexales bacterium]
MLDWTKFKNRELFRLRTLWWAVGTFLLWFGVLCFLVFHDLGQEINRKVSRTLEFRVREFLGESPSKSNRIRILGYDDQSFSTQGKAYLNLEEWAVILEKIDAYNPKMVLIDKIFAIGDSNKYQDAVRRIQALKTQVVVGAYVSPGDIVFRPRLNLERPWYRYQDHLKDAEGGESVFSDRRSYQVYGPAEELQSVFPKSGHVSYPGHGEIEAIMALGDEKLIRHLGFYTADQLSSDGTELIVNGVRLVPDQGRLLINMSDPKHYYKGLKRLDILLRDGSPKDLIHEGDVVLILPNMFTGGADFHLTEFGYVPGGLLVAAVMNSVLTGQWLKKISFEQYVPLVACVLGGALGLLAPVFWFWVTLVFISFFVFFFGLWSFTYIGWVVPWLYTNLGFVGTAVMVLAERSRYSEAQASMLKLVESQKKYLEKEIADAAEMAIAYRPDDIPEWNGFHIQEYHRSCDSASGDWYAFASAKDKKLYHFVMCDITGHGVQAALVVSACKTVLSQMRIADADLFEKEDFIVHYAESLNKILYEQGQGLHNTTLGGVTFDPEEQQLYLMTCGHPWPLYRQASNFQNLPRALKHPLNRIGDESDFQCSLKSYPFRPGDELLVYTDGVPLSENRRILKKHGPLSREKMAKQIVQEATQAEIKKQGSSLVPDDISLVWFSYQP